MENQQTNSQTDSQTKCINFSPLKMDFDMVFIDPNGSPGILKRIWNLVRNLPAETQPAEKNRPWVPHAGGQDDGSLHKLPQMNY